MNTAELLTAFELCPRKGFWSQSWEQNRLNPGRIVSEGIKVAVRATGQRETPFGEVAGDAVMQLATDRGLDTNSHRIYESALHHACLADLLTTVVRKPSDPAWETPPPVQYWMSGCFVTPDGNTLRRIVLVSHWSDERKESESRSWFSLGEMTHYDLPMQMIVFVICQQKDGLRSSPWTRGFLHPRSHQLRFRKKSRSTSEVFNEKWEQIKREDHAEITRETWLEAMLRDDVLPEVCMRIDLPRPSKDQSLRIRQMASQKLERLYTLNEKPEANLSSCDWPLPCPFKKCCHILPEVDPSEKMGFVSLESLVHLEQSPQP